MTTYAVTFVVVVDADSPEEATDEARLLVSDHSFEPAAIEVIE